MQRDYRLWSASEEVIGQAEVEITEHSKSEDQFDIISCYKVGYAPYYPEIEFPPPREMSHLYRGCKLPFQALRPGKACNRELNAMRTEIIQ